MSWFRYFSKFVFRNYQGRVDPERARRFMAIARYSYFFAATTLCFYVYTKGKEAKQLREEEELQEKEKHAFGQITPSDPKPQEKVETSKKTQKID